MSFETTSDFAKAFTQFCNDAKEPIAANSGEVFALVAQGKLDISQAQSFVAVKEFWRASPLESDTQSIPESEEHKRYARIVAQARLKLGFAARDFSDAGLKPRRDGRKVLGIEASQQGINFLNALERFLTKHTGQRGRKSLYSHLWEANEYTRDDKLQVPMGVMTFNIPVELRDYIRENPQGIKSCIEAYHNAFCESTKAVELSADDLVEIEA